MSRVRKRASVAGKKYFRCGRCGKKQPSDKAGQTRVLEDGRTEVFFACHRCKREIHAYYLSAELLQALKAGVQLMRQSGYANGNPSADDQAKMAMLIEQYNAEHARLNPGKEDVLAWLTIWNADEILEFVQRLLAQAKGERP